MGAGRMGLVGVGLAVTLCLGSASAQTAPGPAATERVTSPTTPPAEVAPPSPATGGGAAPVPGAIPAAPRRDADAPSPAEIRALVEAAQATAKATRESVDYARVVPDILQQILAKLDKLEDKLDKVESAVKAAPPVRRR